MTTEVADDPRSADLPSLIAIGVAAGLCSALFGVGGGFVIVPALILTLHFPPKVAAATSLGSIAITAAVGAAVFTAAGAVQWRDALILAPPAVLGTLLGISAQQRLASPTLTALFSVFLALLAVRFLLA